MGEESPIAKYQLRVLIADGDAKMTHALTGFLNTRGARADSATSASAIVPMLDRTVYDVVCLGVDLEGDVSSVTAQAHAQTPPATVVAIRSEDSAATLADSDDVLVKPFRGRELLHLLAEVGARRLAASIAPPAPVEPTHAEPRARDTSGTPGSKKRIHAAPKAGAIKIVGESRRDAGTNQGPPGSATDHLHGSPRASGINRRPPRARASGARTNIFGSSSSSERAAKARAKRRQRSKHQVAPQERDELLSMAEATTDRAGLRPEARRQRRRQGTSSTERRRESLFDSKESTMSGRPGPPPPPRKSRSFGARESRSIASRAHAVPLQGIKLAGVSSARPSWRLSTTMKSRMEFQGDLGERPLSELLSKILSNGFDGCLTLESGASPRRLYFLDGVPVYATGYSSQQLLGTTLVKLGTISLELLAEVLEGMGDDDILGEVLVAGGHVTPDKILEALDRQVFERILGCFPITSGKYVFEEGRQWRDEVQVFRQNPVRIIAVGIKRHVSPNTIAELLSPHLAKYIARTSRFHLFIDHFPDLADIQSILVLIDGDHTLQDLTASSDRDVFDLLRIVWSLHQSGMIIFVDSPGLNEPPPPLTADRVRPRPPEVSAPVLSDAPAPSIRPKRGRTPDSASTTPAAAPSTPGARALSEIERMVARYLARMRHDDHFKLLGVVRDATEAEIEAAYRTSEQALPVAHFEHLPDEVREGAEKVHDALKRAHRVLSNSQRREAYLSRAAVSSGAATPEKPQVSTGEPPRSRGAGVRANPRRTGARRRRPAPPPPGPNSQIRMDARGRKSTKSTAVDAGSDVGKNLFSVQLDRARKASAANQWKNAFRFLRRASDIDSQNPELVALQAWVIYHLAPADDPRKFRVCHDRLELSIELDPTQVDSHLYMARVLLKHEAFEDAMGYYRNVLDLSAGHPEAVAAVAALESMISDETVTHSGVFGKLKGWLDQ